jgi:sirohydrochlorin cobaltochelatase
VSVLLGVAHGSRDDAAQEVVRELLVLTAALRPGLRTEAAYVDNASPSIRAAIARLVAEGERDITVVPLLLGAASHSKTDVAGSVQAARFAHPGLVLRYGRPLGPHPVVVEVLEKRLVDVGAAALPVVLVANGSLDPDANAGVAATARLLWEGRGHPTVDYAFLSTTRPTLPEVLDRLRGAGAVAVARYFLSPGHLPTKAAELAAESGLDVVVSEPLGASEGLASLVLGRYDEARTGDIRMNCDACLYRIPFPGREGAVGAPQAPHNHPDDA